MSQNSSINVGIIVAILALVAVLSPIALCTGVFMLGAAATVNELDRPVARGASSDAELPSGAPVFRVEDLAARADRGNPYFTKYNYRFAAYNDSESDRNFRYEVVVLDSDGFTLAKTLMPKARPIGANSSIVISGALSGHGENHADMADVRVLW